MCPDDIAGVLAIASDEASAPHWPEFEYKRLLAVAAETPHRRGAWVGVAEDAAIRGFAIASAAAEQVEIESVVVAPEHRRQGVAQALLAAVAGWGQDVSATVMLLEVRVSNAAARGLYAKAGFGEDGVRRGYYRNPDEDAVLLSLKLSDNKC